MATSTAGSRSPTATACRARPVSPSRSTRPRGCPERPPPLPPQQAPEAPMSVFDPSPAEAAASPADTDINSLDLTFLRDGVATPIDFPIEQATMNGRIRRTVEGASELTLQVHDPDWALLDSGLFDTELTGGFTAK